MRQIDKVLIRVGQSFRANAWQMATKIYLPAMRHPLINGVRLGLGVAIIGTLLAETKLSNQGIGFLIIQAYSLFDMPRMYAMLIVLFVRRDRRQCAGRPARRIEQHHGSGEPAPLGPHPEEPAKQASRRTAHRPQRAWPSFETRSPGAPQDEVHKDCKPVSPGLRHGGTLRFARPPR